VGEIADWLRDQGMDALALHHRGECEFGCEYCGEEEDERNTNPGPLPRLQHRKRTPPRRS